ncbi:MAG: phage portal protein, partial [Terriglobales bacterium]
RIYGVPLHLLAAGDKTSTYASVEQFELIFVKHTMLPWYFLWEQELDSKLLDPAEQGRQFTKFNLDALLRGDKLSRAQANEVELRNGALYVNEWRDLEDRDPSAVAQADEPLILASQMAPLSQVGKQPKESPGVPPAPKRSEEELVARLYEQQARRCAQQMADSAAKIAARYADDPAKYVVEIHDAVGRIADDFERVFDRQHFEWFEGQCGSARAVPVASEFWRKYGPDVLMGAEPKERAQ